jgi:hypothetical protein
MTDIELLNLATRLEESRVNATVNTDISTLGDLLSEDLCYGHTGGYVDDKKLFLEKLSSGVYSYYAMKTKINQATAVGESGLIINGESTIEVSASGEKKVFHAIYLAVWRQETGIWRFLSLQAAFKK